MGINADRKQRIVAYWLLIGVFMIIVQIIIGGITRLTDAGLSITEWAPFMGAIPPLNHPDWLAAFESYKEIAHGQFIKEHADFTLSDFKFIYFWEWFHRLWARTLGIVFLLPFIYFLIKKYFTRRMIAPLVLLFFLGGLQGLIGWIMVKSGLNDTSVRVDHIKLAIHFMSALVLLIYTFWFALKLLIPERQLIAHSKSRNWIIGILVILVIQLVYGAFMAGLRAAPAAPTWPSLNGGFAPPTLFSHSWIDSPLNVQFIHRTLGYILFIIIIWSYFAFHKTAKLLTVQTLFKKAIKWPVIFVCLQVILGITAVLLSPTIAKGHFGEFELSAAFHQTVAILLLLSLVYLYYLLRRKAL